MLIYEAVTSDRSVLKSAMKYLSDNGFQVRPKIILSRGSKIPHLRLEMTPSESEEAAKAAGVSLTYDLGDDPVRLSGTYDAGELTFPKDFDDPQLAGETIYVLPTKREGGKAVRKALSPVNLQLTGRAYTKASLAARLKKVLPDLISDPVFLQFLLELVDVAMGERKAVSPEILSEIPPRDIRITGIDFGEVLTPLIFAKDNEIITFPSGNSMLADVEIDGHPISVKSATGSGTSFRAIAEYIKRFKEDANASPDDLIDDDDRRILNFFDSFIETKGNNIDKIIAGAHIANSPERQALVRLIGKPNFTFADLKAFASKFDSYSDFLRAIYPVTIAAGYQQHGAAKPVGMPADFKYYLGLTDKKPKKRQAGRASWDLNPADAGAKILTYILGSGFLAMAKEATTAEKYSKVLKKILTNVQASLVKIDIAKDGTIKTHKKLFTDADFAFQYHAPSHIPGNNLPGFMIKLD